MVCRTGDGGIKGSKVGAASVCQYAEWHSGRRQQFLQKLTVRPTFLNAWTNVAGKTRRKRKRCMM